MNPAAE
ncbi:hypothetical protein ECTW14313_2303, partial [Escherichia coli O157:H7 str. TW14313]